MELAAHNLNDLARVIHQTARSKGFYDDEFLPEPGMLTATKANRALASEKLALIHSEVSEILDARRDGDLPKEAEEVADVLIRVLDYAAWRGIDLDTEVAAKMTVNEQRPRLHGRQF
jgi:NTP pyrophosphatase (non-canonical NTP hydrolase)